MLQLNVSNHVQTAGCHKPENRTAGELKIKKAQVLVNYLPQTKSEGSRILFFTCKHYGPDSLSQCRDREKDHGIQIRFLTSAMFFRLNNLGLRIIQSI